MVNIFQQQWELRKQMLIQISSLWKGVDIFLFPSSFKKGALIRGRSPTFINIRVAHCALLLRGSQTMRLDSTKFHLDGGVNMAIYHFTTRIIKSSIGKCAVASAAYISGQKLKDTRLGLSFNYTRSCICRSTLT